MITIKQIIRTLRIDHVVMRFSIPLVIATAVIGGLAMFGAGVLVGMLLITL